MNELNKNHKMAFVNSFEISEMNVGDIRVEYLIKIIKYRYIATNYISWYWALNFIYACVIVIFY